MDQIDKERKDFFELMVRNKDVRESSDVALAISRWVGLMGTMP